MLSNPKSSRLLVWFSLILLMAFLVSWNVNQYHAEKNELIQDLNDQMNLAYSKYNDSIFTSIFSMIDNRDNVFSKASRSVTINNTVENLNGSISVHTHSTSTPMDNNISVMFSNNQVLSSDSTESFGNLPLSAGFITSLLSDSSTFKMDHQPDSLRTEEQFEDMINDTKNSNLQVKKYFDENLIALNFPSVYDEEYLTESADIMDNKITIAYRNIHNKSPKLHATFSTYKPYLLKKITPSLLMSGALFSIMSLAFFMMLKTTKEQQRLTDMKSEFISNMTHELKTPIATVGVALEALSDYGGMNDQKRKEEYLDISKHELNRLSILVDKVMQMSSFEKDAAVMEFEPLDLRKITVQMINYMKLPFEKNKVNFNCDLTGQNFNIQGDRLHLTNVLYNLIDNAIKYAHEQPVIDIYITEELKQIKFEIKDQGIGIPEKYQDKIFDRFFRVPTDNVHNVKGHGVGLSYVYDVIKKHKGELRVLSEVGKGTSIIFQIPKLA